MERRPLGSGFSALAEPRNDEARLRSWHEADIARGFAVLGNLRVPLGRWLVEVDAGQKECVAPSNGA